MSASPNQITPNPAEWNSNQYDPERHSIDTPELVGIEMPLAGIGSRFIALLIDSLIWIAAIIVLVILAAVLMPAFESFNKLSAQWVTAIFIFAAFLLQWGYFTLFEAFWNGKTPGKKLAKIRVIQRSGRPIGIIESMARNFIRIVDSFPYPLYAVGIIAIFVTRQGQRLGDLAAGTIVVRDRVAEPALWSDPSARSFTAATLIQQAPALPAEPHMRVSLPPDGVAKLTAADLEVLENFLARRLDMPLETRAALAGRIASAIRAKSGLDMPDGISTETFLEATARHLRDQARLA